MSAEDQTPVLLSERRVAERYDVCVRTLARWDETVGLNFPPAIIINRRRYRSVKALNDWDAANARETIARHMHERGEQETTAA